ncbi:hypothetical protein [Meridianimarinicoccus aquatilis]|uniref:DUF3450 family protein n=1 Tax=Meridianimarinicoccus aquatilis TaxID=2552766 RepID=A0A4R6AP09_9RHOB|nr:hypothetical protein [Fluviibacterium aquatile]QIE43484.1 hypothetical protein G5B39_15775 [Rhodobacteraceae bacterium SC52]TDL85487.1 hypothetical protein E2L05_15355 [Fluviibacterium aquatile]
MADRFSGGGLTITVRNYALPGGLILLLAACSVSENPADGGFISGVSGLSSGTYDQRIDEKTAAVETERQRQAQLTAELSGLEAEYAELQRQIIAQRSQAAAAGKPIPASLDADVRATLAASPSGSTDAARLENYRKAVADARKLSNQLANI